VDFAEKANVLGASIAAETVRVVVMELQVVALGAAFALGAEEGALIGVARAHVALDRSGDAAHTR